MMTLWRRARVAARPASSASLYLAAAGFILWLIAVREADFLRMTNIGLISVLHWPYFVGLGFVAIGFAIELLRVHLRPVRLIVLIVVLIVFVFGTASAVAPVAGLEDSWLMAGFVQYIFHHGHVLLNFDARFSWPGSFSLGAVLVAFTGQANAYGFLRWFPLFIELCYLAPLIVIARCSGVGRRASWLGIALFYSTNWIYQDYFSPQALNYLFFLVVIAVVLACWQPKQRARLANVGSHTRERLRQSRFLFSYSRISGGDALTDLNGFTTLMLFGILGILCFASATSHQLTPFAIIMALSACLLTRRLGWSELVIVSALFAVGWLSLGASNYWIGHFAQIFGEVGKLGSTYGQNVSSRITGSASHLLVVKTRIALTASLYLLAGIGFLRRSPDSRSLEVLAGAPFLLLAVQSYGGEGLLRVVLFGLPFTSLLAASAVLPNRNGAIRSLVPNFRPGRFTRVTLCVVVAIAVLGFALATTLVRGGNDAYEAFSSGELAAVNYAYNHAHAGQTIGMVAPFLPGGQRDVGTVAFFIAANGDGSSSVSYDQKVLLQTHPAFIILSQSQEAWGEIVAGYPVGWEGSLEAYLVTHGYQIDAEWRTATVLQPTAST
jgi:hypothetical protein